MPRSPSRTPRSKRQRAENQGRRGELIAALLLVFKGYRIIGKRVRNRAGEIDLIAKRGNVIAFVEVKYRAAGSDQTQALLAVNQRRILAAAKIFMAQTPRFSTHVFRFDVIYLEAGKWPTHLVDAFSER